MHIPRTATTEIEILSFEEALSRSGMTGGYDTDRWLYVPDFYTEYRYILGTKGEKPLICIGINPSTAKPDHLDPTLKSVERIARANGYDSFLMFNVYAQRATNPGDMEKGCNPFLHRQNMAAFDYILSLSDAPTVWAAWGNIVEQRGYLKQCLREMISIGENRGARWVSAGAFSKKGHPHHPLYLRSDTAVEEFDVKAYWKNIL